MTDKELIKKLAEALQPFADIGSVYVRRAETFGHDDASGVWGASDREMDKTITVGECRAALTILEKVKALP